MSSRSILDRLCEQFHIASEYHDIWGKRHAVSERTRRDLLAAMGVPTQGREAMQRALAEAEAADGCRALPPVLVAREDEANISIRVGVPGEGMQHRYRWQIVEEDGAGKSGEFYPAELVAWQQAAPEVAGWQYGLLVIAELPACGYHHLELQDLDAPGIPAASMSLIIAPRRCYQPAAIRNGGRVWGSSVQLYAVRSARNWGIGDFTDLVRLLEFSAQVGAGLLGLNPLHALFPDEPGRASPYSPSSRLFLNILYLDVEAVPDFAECDQVQQQVAGEEFQARLRALRATELVDYEGVAAVKLETLERLYIYFRQQHLATDSERARAFHRFQEEQGEALHRHALYEALRVWLHKREPKVRGWPDWPKAYRDPNADAVLDFAAGHREEVEFYEYLQWHAELQLQEVGRHAYELGLGVGLYQDLALSVDRAGAEAWGNQDLYAVRAHIGSPPDEFNLKGQDWGLPPWRPEQLRARAYAPFIATLRQNMRSAGALRIDHVMGLLRLFWVPQGKSPQQGSYVFYPFEEILGILALESQRNECLVIGEDLGTVPDEVREALPAMGVLSYRLLFFEKTAAGCFKAPHEYELDALVAVSTHDLPTLAGFWQGRDLELREQLQLFPHRALRDQQVIARAGDRARLLMALEREALLPKGMSIQPLATPVMTPELDEAIHSYLARTPARVMVLQLEDLLGQLDQVNLPGTTDQYPNWQRKLSLDLELWREDEHILAVVSALREERGCAVNPPVSVLPSRTLPAQANIPRSTYRLQLHRGFTFAQAAEIAPYLHQLGISHCYTSPCLQARPGSTHGYDIIDHGALNTELGGEAGFTGFTDVLKQQQMGLIMDMVPNHMGVMGSDNAWWLDVLENGPASIYADYFDIDWTPLKDALRGKILVPVLGDHYGSILERGELELVYDPDRGSFYVRYYEHELPIDPGEYPYILAHNIDQLEERLGATNQQLLVYQSLITAFENLPRRSETDAAQIAERRRDKGLHKASLTRLYRDADIAHFMDENLQTFNSRHNVELLHALLEQQAWRIAYWRVATDEINYRRFFEVNELAGLRIENPAVFEATHELVLELIADNRVQGLRIDHPDGLYDPGNYFRLLQTRVVSRQPVSAGAGTDAADRPLYLLVEKILADHERLRQDWAVHGTTGYEFGSLVNGLFVNPAAELKMNRVYREFISDDVQFDRQVYSSKKLIIRTALASELNVLAQQLSRIAELDRHTRDFSLSALREALSEVVAWFPVYRTYISAEGSSEADRHYVDWAVNVARKRSRAADTSVYDFVREVLLFDIAEGKSEEYRQRILAFAMKFQQYTGPVMAKGFEDTTFYRYNRLLSLNEVGGEPVRFGVSVAAFHHQNLERSQNWPHAMLTTSTHDSKRSEDVRARINVLTEVPDIWRGYVKRWARINRSRKRMLNKRLAPSRNDEYLFYQTLAGAWPLEELDAAALAGFRQRMQDYMLKAVKEAKLHTSWINPDIEYEQAVVDFVAALLGDMEKNPFLADFQSFQGPLSRAGLFNSLAQLALKFTSPGMPDIYQGNELWDLSLVDPDNRRPVDYGCRRDLLDGLQAALKDNRALTAICDELVDHIEDGRAKLYLTWRSLQLRHSQAELFQVGEYVPLTVSGTYEEHLCAFARGHAGQWVITVVPRLIYTLGGGGAPLGEGVWADTCIELPAADWRNWLTGEEYQAEAGNSSWRLPVGQVLRHFPVAFLLGQQGAAPDPNE
ncbi:malto-oligosyltrehalose synthase [Sulfuriflexus sp.]|uniref:malto-oligosyltrehalose synthase n=1 Tax=Sulfuriflexus sp. TaxID=2015443 RepID=UPI0028CD9F27|nr:malto-oligosyltrehalose synthase [Sulfuriflexus sp.]MDT8402999.1 malto-oligosyltrehalose synthase [Sulfuriflexus sp.]